MADGVGWIAHAFKLFDALISPRRPPRPDQPIASATDEGLTPDAPAGEPAASLFPLEPASQAEPLVPHAASEVEPAPAEQIESSPVPLDDEGRRKLIRQLFNEYWRGIDDKPPTFAERLEIAERYINDQLAGRAVGWRLDAVTRKQLGLPSSRVVG